MSILQKCYELAGSEKKYVRATNEAKLEVQILMALSLLINADVSKSSTDIMFFSDASLTGETTLYCRLSAFINCEEVPNRTHIAG